MTSFINPDDFLVLAENLKNCIDITESKVIKKIFAEDAMKRALFARFAFKALGDKDKIKRSNTIFKKCLPYKHTLKYLILTIFPFVHRLILLKLDPSMRAYENKLKKEKHRKIVSDEDT